MKAVWFQKWLVHLRLRPEEFAGRVQLLATGTARFPVHPDVLNSAGAEAVRCRFGGYLLPQAFPEGGPAHPSYPAGHAAVAGAGITVLKAFFNQSFILQDAVEATEDGAGLIAYSGGPLTVGGELDKLACNIAHARDSAGAHWRSDSAEGLRLGEQVAIALLQDELATLTEDRRLLQITTLDGRAVSIGPTV